MRMCTKYGILFVVAGCQTNWRRSIQINPLLHELQQKCWYSNIINVDNCCPYLSTESCTKSYEKKQQKYCAPEVATEINNNDVHQKKQKNASIESSDNKHSILYEWKDCSCKNHLRRWISARIQMSGGIRWYKCISFFFFFSLGFTLAAKLIVLAHITSSFQAWNLQI